MMTPGMDTSHPHRPLAPCEIPCDRESWLDPERRAAFSGRARAFLDRQPWDRVDLPMICRCLRSTRLPG